MVSVRYFPEPEPALRQALGEYLEWLGKQSVQVKRLQSLLLAGGYGRGEGGIWRDAGSGVARLYNDMEFYVFAPSVENSLLHQWMEEGERRFGIEMEFKVMAPAAFARARPSMFYYDLMCGHVLLAGSPAWVQSLPRHLSDPAAIPAVEAGRLLVNRAMSLLRCRRWLRGEEILPADFCDRITNKLQLALGDAVLCLRKDYHWSCRERNQRLSLVADPPNHWEQIQQWHGAALQFKFHPQLSNRTNEDWQEHLQTLTQVWLETFLWVEGQRLGQVFSQPAAYFNMPHYLFPEENPWRNRLRQWRDLSRKNRLPWTGGDHPRSRFWRALAALLAGQPAAAANLLGVEPSSPLARIEECCRSAWKMYP